MPRRNYWSIKIEKQLNAWPNSGTGFADVGCFCFFVSKWCGVSVIDTLIWFN